MADIIRRLRHHLGIGFFGMLLGNSLIGGLADRFGRKTLVVGCCVFFGLLTLGIAWAKSPTELMVLRFLASLGLGGAMPNVVALTAEFLPKRIRALSIGIMTCGIPLGGTIGGFVAAPLVPSHGWPLVFIIGGILPLVLALVLFLWMPESIGFLAAVRKDFPRVAALMRRIDPAGSYPPAATYVMPERNRIGAPVKQLFTDGRTAPTLLLWCIVLTDLLCLHFLFSWSPTLFRQVGLPLPTAIMLGSVVFGSSIFGIFIWAPLMDRFGVYRVAPIQFFIGTGALVLAGFAGHDVPFLVAGLVLIAMTLGDGPVATQTMSTLLYPTAIRSTGVGWALGVGRSGSIIGPILGGLVLSVTFGGLNAVYLVIAPFGLVAAVFTLFLGQQRRKAELPSVPQTQARAI